MDGSSVVGLGRMRGVMVLVGDGGGCWLGDDGANEGIGEGRCLEKLRKPVDGRDMVKGDMVDANEVRLLLRPECVKVGEAGVVFAVKLLLRVLLLVDVDELEEEELTPLLIFLIFERAPMLLRGGLVTKVGSSRQI